MEEGASRYKGLPPTKGLERSLSSALIVPLARLRRGKGHAGGWYGLTPRNVLSQVSSLSG